MLGWLPSIIKVSDEEDMFIHIHKMNDAFLDGIKELYTEVIGYFQKSVKAIKQLQDQWDNDDTFIFMIKHSQNYDQIISLT